MSIENKWENFSNRIHNLKGHAMKTKLILQIINLRLNDESKCNLAEKIFEIKKVPKGDRAKKLMRNISQDNVSSKDSPLIKEEIPPIKEEQLSSNNEKDNEKKENGCSNLRDSSNLNSSELPKDFDPSKVKIKVENGAEEVEIKKEELIENGMDKNIPHSSDINSEESKEVKSPTKNLSSRFLDQSYLDKLNGTIDIVSEIFDTLANLSSTCKK